MYNVRLVSVQEDYDPKDDGSIAEFDGEDVRRVHEKDGSSREEARGEWVVRSEMRERLSEAPCHGHSRVYIHKHQ